MRDGLEPALTLMRKAHGLDDRAFLETMIVYHAAPTLRRLKPATLICPGRNARRLLPAWRECRAAMRRRLGVEIANLREEYDSLLLLIHRPDALVERLDAPGARRLLGAAGYPVGDNGLTGMLRELASRCGPDREFPHEIGVFLGYPPGDVECFMRARGGACLETCAWKAYGDIESARASHTLFRRAKIEAARLFAAGLSAKAVAERLRRSA